MFLVVTKLSTSTFTIISIFVKSEETNQTMQDVRQSANQISKEVQGKCQLDEFSVTEGIKNLLKILVDSITSLQ